jgi:hypothetical protein
MSFSKEIANKYKKSTNGYWSHVQSIDRVAIQQNV